MSVDHCTSPARVCLPRPRPSAHPIRVGLLGLGHVNSAVARLILTRAQPRDVQVTGALVRDPSRPRAVGAVAQTSDPEVLFATRPTVMVEALGGVEPARTLILEAIARGIPVVTANKSVLARHGGEILEAASLAGVPCRYEASVIAGVPFLGTFARRPYASAIASLSGIVNGTTNFILSGLQDGIGDYASVLADAQRRGFAEPDPANDVRGIDAVEKLAILIREFSGRRVAPSDIETTGIEHVSSIDLAHARELGGTLKPVVHAGGLDSPAATMAAWAGPAFVPECHPLARVHQAANGLCLRDVAGSHLCLTGPGAGPDVTAVTVLDDVLEAVTASEDTAWSPETQAGRVAPPAGPWFVRIASATALPRGADIAGLLGAHGVWAERTTARSTREGGDSQAFLTYPCARARIESALAALAATTGSTTRVFRALERLG